MIGPNNSGQRMVRVVALCIHLFTASGAACAFVALAAAIEREFATMFVWLGLALFVDGIDGTLARLARVKEHTPWMDGDVLDLVIDFLTYVFVPMVALWRSDLMPAGLAMAFGIIVVVGSAFYFADTRMKTQDQWFRGFPTLWNVFVLYLFVFRPPTVVSLGIGLLLVAGMFAPIVFVHPLRVRRLRTVTVAVTMAWLACAAVAVAQDFQTGLGVKLGLILSGLYIVALPLTRHSPFADNRKNVA